MTTLMDLLDEINVHAGKLRKLENRASQLDSEIKGIEILFCALIRDKRDDAETKEELTQKWLRISYEQVDVDIEIENLKKTITNLCEEFTRIYTGGNEYVD